jgi:glutamine amidotransferase-like uncharacterized protein
MASISSTFRSPLTTCFTEPVIVKIFSGTRVSYESVKGLTNVIQTLFKHPMIETIEEESGLHFRDIDLTMKTVVVLPGARTTREWNFTSEQKKEMQSLCERGLIKVLLVCAGAFYASETVVYNQQSKEKDSSFSLFKGACVGPAFQTKEKFDIQVEPVTVPCGEGNIVINVVMNGGGYFVPPAKEENYEVLARYKSIEKEPIAALACQPNKDGTYNAVLVAPHFEHDEDTIDFESLERMFPDQKGNFTSMAKKLNHSRLFRLAAMQGFFEKMGCK